MSETTTTETPLEVRIFTDFKTELIKTISWNYEELEENIRKTLEPFKNLVLDKNAESIKFAKGKRAEINKLAKVITDARIETKKKFLAPYEEFEARCNALIKMCQSSSGQFDEFVKACETEIKQKKLDAAHAHLIKRLGEVFGNDAAAKDSPYWAEFVKGNSKWANLTYSERDIFSDIENEICKAEEAVKTVNELFAAHSPEALEKARIEIRKNFDLVRTSTVVNAYVREQEEIKRRAAERLAREEAARKAKEEAEARAKAELEERRRQMQMQMQMQAAQTPAPAPESPAPTQTPTPTVTPSAEPQKPVLPTPTPPESDTMRAKSGETLIFDVQFNCSSNTIIEIINKAVSSGLTVNSAVLHIEGTREDFGKFSDAISDYKSGGLDYKRCINIVCA